MNTSSFRIVVGLLGAAALLAGCCPWICPEGLGLRARPAGRGQDGGVAQRTWMGRWEDKTTGDGGEVQVTIMAYTGMAYVTYRVDGDLFDCGQPLIGSLFLSENVDFTKKGLKLDQKDSILGDLDLTKKGKRIRGGASGACHGSGPEWTTKTKLGRAAVSGKLLLQGSGGVVSKASFRVKPCQECAGVGGVG